MIKQYCAGLMMVMYIALTCLCLHGCQMYDELDTTPPLKDHFTDSVAVADSINKIKQISEYFNSFTEYKHPASFENDVAKNTTDDIARIMTINGITDFFIPSTTEYSYISTANTLSFPFIDELQYALPGLIVSAESIVKGECQPILGINKYRNPNTLHFSVVNGNVNKKVELDEISYDKIKQGVELMQSTVGSQFPANQSYTIEKVHNEAEFANQLNLNYNSADPNCEYQRMVGKFFNSVKWDNPDYEKIMVCYWQKYYTIKINDLYKFEEFKPETQLDSIKIAVGENTTPTYISSVSYGRHFVVIYEKLRYNNHQSKETETELKAIYEAITVENPSEVRRIEERIQEKAKIEAITNNESLKNSPYYEPPSKGEGSVIQVADMLVHAMQIGAQNHQEFVDASSKGINGLHQYILDGTRCSPENPGKPVDMSVKYISTNNHVRRGSKASGNYLVREYEPEPVYNQITITLNSLNASASANGDGYKIYNSDASSTITDAKVTIEYSDLREEETFKLNSGFNINGSYTINHKYKEQTITLPKLGATPNAKVKIEFTVNRHLCAYMNMGLPKKQTINTNVIMELNYIDKKWVIKETNNSEGANNCDFKSLYIKKSVEHKKTYKTTFTSTFKLDYTIKVDRDIL